ncbi:MAG: PQQ-dependent sugar dehydrogenase [Flavobacteriales bacterium]|jgi:glucose/arabinose dehydrogenase/PKD repeat protein|nr:PQQ-dependent sugar dehydrogenase [Flavobacteriales bacterium]MBK7269894.1 PQQ-dependent sugar dehydrogenase [Flavobacteriales bacterium]MBK7753486.1 PQQ-dependent sugar dehydrogenase [Flavobacteriales bacterium]MBK9077075.1 PQQ-dependent sugar dehydrogenase [Flavobacteriales bacterium]MBK9538495.1 PQQ-dependent sugar dehydrogenase [Flavobacteriales bacterium]
MPFLRSLRAFVTLLLFFSVAHFTQAQPQNFVHTQIIGGIDSPTSVAFLPDGRALICRKIGEVLITSPIDQPPVTTTTYMEIPADNTAEHGLIGVWIDPDFANNQQVWFYYSTFGMHDRLSRFTHLGDSAQLSSEVVVWETIDPYVDCCHTGGALAFLPDGTIFLAVGDDYTPANAQDLSSPFGKLHRFLPDGTAPADNPYYDPTPGPYNANGELKTVYASGLRNPYRGDYDPETGRFYIGVVGANNHQLAWEDIVLAAPAANYGWPLCGELGRLPDGACDDPQFTDPVFSYHHQGSGAAITAGFTYRGSSFPAAWDGRFFVGEFIRGWMKWLTFDAQGTTVASQGPFLDTAALGGVQSNFCTQLLQGPGDALYYLSYYDDLITFEGGLHRITYEPTGTRPECLALSADVMSGIGPSLSVTFTGDALDPLGGALSYVWEWGDGTPAGTTAISSHVYQGPGNYSAELLVINATDTTSCGTIPITVEPHPLSLDVELMLDGPFDAITGLMRDELRSLGLVPMTEPYTALGFSLTSGTGATIAPTVLSTAGPFAIVDWVLIELRAASDPLTVLQRFPALVRRDGQVVDLDGTSQPVTLAPSLLGYIAVRHRNHLGAMSAAPLNLSTTNVALNFRAGATACYGVTPRRTVGTVRTLWAGNVFIDGTLRYTGANNDRDPILVAIGGSPPTATISGYLQTDVNLDGTVKYAGSRNDRDVILISVGGNAPTATRPEGLP